MNEGLDVIVVNYRTPNDLTRFLASYSITDKPPGRLFVYNVAPERDDREVVERWREEIKFDVIESSGNIGYAAAVNTWARYCDRDAIGIFNADIVLTKGALNRCYRELMAHDDWGVLGPRQVDSKGRVTHAGILGERGEEHTHRLWHAYTDWIESDDEDLIIEVATVMGSAMIVRRACWEELTLCSAYQAHLADEFPHAMFGAMLPTKLYYEETFLCYHAIEHIWKVIYYGPVTLIHEWHKSISRHVPQDEELYMVDISKAQFRRACDAVHGMPYA